MKNWLFLFLVVFMSISLFAQPVTQATGTIVNAADTADFPYWIRMMQDPQADYFKTIRAFNQYWNDRKFARGNGWKVFKRWEYIMRNRVQTDGTKPAPDDVFLKWKAYNKTRESVAGNWVSMGPAVIPAPGPAGYEGLGRLNIIAYHPTLPNTIYAGSPSGSFWISIDNGLSWTTTTDNMPTIGISAILVDQTDPARILVGTGDRDHGDAPGMGVFMSTDGGFTWSPSKAGMGNVTVGKLVQHPGNPLIILAATTGGIFRSTDGGINWTQTNSNSFQDMALKPGGSAIVYATSDGNFYRSDDNGITFTCITNGLTGGQRGAIAVTPANPDYVYFIQSNTGSGFQGVYRSSNSGLSFTTRSTSPNILDWSCDGSGTGGQGWYDLVIAADPVYSETIYVGGINVWKSVNGGTTWSIISHWYGGCSVPAVHADCHYLGFSPITGYLYAGNDGGVYYSTNRGTTWTDRTVGMTIGQIYKLGQSKTIADKIINGFQDNGTYTHVPGGWEATGGGDGMECAIDPQNPLYIYYTLYFGSVFRRYNNGSDFQLAGDGLFGINETGDWVTPFILSEDDPQKMFIGYKNIWRCGNIRSNTPSWSKISTGETSNCYVMEQSPANMDILYVVRAGSVKRTNNANATAPLWVSCTLPDGATPTDLETHPTNNDVVYASANGKIFKSTDRGDTWNLMSGTLPGVPVNCIVYDKNSNEGLYIGTQTGVLYKNSSMTDWVIFNTNLPVVDVRELEIYYDEANPDNDRIVAATYGRGLWRSDLYPRNSPVSVFTATPLAPCISQTVQFADLSSNNPTSWQWKFSPGSVTFTDGTGNTSQNPRVRFLEEKRYLVKLIIANSYGSDSTTNSIPVGGYSIPFTESFESWKIPVGWTVVNPDHWITWDIGDISGNGNSLKAARINFYDYSAPGQTDDLISPAIDLSMALHPFMTFKVAYRRYSADYYDRLKIFVSTDCGQTWGAEPVYDKWGDALATGPDIFGFGFVPVLSEDWRTDSLDLSDYAGTHLTIKFEAVNGWGNYLYLDDVHLSDQEDIEVKDLIVNSGQEVCRDAKNSITVAGNGTIFRVDNGASARIIAGQKIMFLDGTRVDPGGYMNGSITHTGQYCSFFRAGKFLPEVSDAAYLTDDVLTDGRKFKIYPNPALDEIWIETLRNTSTSIRAEVFNLSGKLLSTEQVSGGKVMVISLTSLSPGIYFLRLTSEGENFIEKIVKR